MINHQRNFSLGPILVSTDVNTVLGFIGGGYLEPRLGLKSLSQASRLGPVFSRRALPTP